MSASLRSNRTLCSTPWQMSLLALVLACLCSPLHAARVTALGCQQVTLQENFGDQNTFTFDEFCLEVIVDTEEVEFGPYQEQVRRQDSALYGACDDSGETLDYTATTRMRWAIDAEPGANGHTSALLDFHFGEQFTEESGERVFEDRFTIPPSMSGGEVCFDGELLIVIEAEAAIDFSPGVLSNLAALAGLFYDPANPGHGYSVLWTGDALVVYYYGHTETGERLWLVSEPLPGPVQFFQPLDLVMYEVAGGTFGQPDAKATPWGDLFLRFDDCDTATATLDGTDGVLAMDLARLVGLPRVRCNR